jgi:hypothetical protein
MPTVCMNREAESVDSFWGTRTVCSSDGTAEQARAACRDGGSAQETTLRHAGDSLAPRIFPSPGVCRPRETFLASATVAYLVLLPALPIGAFVCNFFVYPKKHRRWEGRFMCQRCGLLIEPHPRSQSVAHA